MGVVAAPVSVNENVPSAAKKLFVNKVQDAIGLDMSVEAQSRKGLLAGPVPVTTLLPFANIATLERCGARTMRKIVPPPPVPPAEVVP